MLTRATLSYGLPKAPRIPVCSLSAPAQDNILLIRTTWYGWARTRRWKPSLPAVLTRYLECVSLSLLLRSQTYSFAMETYLLAVIRAASRPSEVSCSNSLETKWMHSGNSSTFARLRPRSKIRILGSGTPRLNRDFGYGYIIKKHVSRSLFSCPCLATPCALCLSSDALFANSFHRHFSVSVVAYLVLAVAVASRRATCHFDGVL